MKRKIISIDNYFFGGRLRNFYRGSRKNFSQWALEYPQILRIRVKLRHRLGSNLYRQIRHLNVVSFPNSLEPLYSLKQSGYKLEKILAICGIKAKQFNPWKKCDLIINWQALTINKVQPKNYVAASYKCVPHDSARPWRDDVNFSCDDVSKVKVGRLHKEIMGYDLDIDPTKYSGLAVCKSNENGRHDGRIIDCPIKPDEVEPNVVYNILVDNSDGQYTTDFRVFYIKGILDVFSEKKSRVESRFSMGGSKAVLRQISDEFSTDEVDAIENFCKNMGADYGELDIMRDAESRRIYIFDFASTPMGQSRTLPEVEKLNLLEEMSFVFCKRVLEPLCVNNK